MRYPVRMLVSGAVFSAVLSAASCTVLEDRIDCPCRVEVDFSSLEESLLPVRLYAVSSGSCLARISIDEISEPVVLELPRRGVELMAVSGEGRAGEGSGPLFGGISIPEGEECPPVFFWRETVDTGKESVRLEPGFRKQYCILTMTLPDGYGPPAPGGGGISFEYEGNVAGYGSDMAPLPGPFSFIPEVEDSSGKTFSVCLPRQMDASLMLHVLRNGRPVCSFPVGSYMEAYGYDWSSEDLSDMALSLDFASWPIQAFPDGQKTEVFHDVRI